MRGQKMRQKNIKQKGRAFMFVRSDLVLTFVRSHTFYFEGTELCVGPDPYQKGSITGN